MLVVVVPFLLVTSHWRTLLGLTITGIALVLISIACTGWDGTMAFVNKLLGFSRDATAASPLELKTWKYVDLNAFTRLLVGPDLMQKLLFAGLALPALMWILIRAYRTETNDPGQCRLAWASVLLATPVINLYVGMYDSVLAVLGALWLVDGTRSERPIETRWWLVALLIAPWITQPLAKSIHFQVYSLVLIGVALWGCRLGGPKNLDTGDGP
ncbi:MAG: glycosyltransferase 87 family protein [Planctomycetes bacterium]|nr:glycosyltransferase 87 family protein [Planctomycetota bacterium]